MKESTPKKYKMIKKLKKIYEQNVIRRKNRQVKRNE